MTDWTRRIRRAGVWMRIVGVRARWRLTQMGLRRAHRDVRAALAVSEDCEARLRALQDEWWALSSRRR